jgi:hypothetical protein
LRGKRFASLQWLLESTQ